MSTLRDAKKPKLIDKHLAAEAELKAAALENQDKVEKAKALKAKKS